MMSLRSVVENGRSGDQLAISCRPAVSDLITISLNLHGYNTRRRIRRRCLATMESSSSATTRLLFRCGIELYSSVPLVLDVERLGAVSIV
jgi:hypothetical protein